MSTIQISSKEDYPILQLNRPKVNAINHQMVREIRSAVQSIAKDESARGLIMTGLPHFFSAGLDVIELYDYNQSEMHAFMTDFGMMHIELVRFAKPFICAISGYSPAGGTVLALAADYRIMAAGEKYTIGLNEMAVSIQISHNLATAYAFWLGQASAYRYIMEGRLLHVQDALECGLVDEVVAPENVLTRAEEKMQQYLSFHPDILHHTKQKLRNHWLNQLTLHTEADLNQALEMWWTPSVRQRMKRFVEGLKG